MNASKVSDAKISDAKINDTKINDTKISDAKISDAKITKINNGGKNFHHVLNYRPHRGLWQNVNITGINIAFDKKNNNDILHRFVILIEDSVSKIQKFNFYDIMMDYSIVQFYL